MSHFVTAKSVNAIDAFRQHLLQNADVPRFCLDKYTLDRMMAKTLFDFLCNISRVEILEIRNSKLGATFFRLFPRALVGNTTLKGLSLRLSSLMRDADMQAFVKGLFCLVAPPPGKGVGHLKFLDLTAFGAREPNLWVQAVAKGIRLEQCRLDTLVLVHLTLNAEMGVVLGQALAKNTTLSKVELQSNPNLFSTSNSVIAFRDALIENKTLEWLNISYTGITGPRKVEDEGHSHVDILYEGLRQNNTLKVFAIGGNEILLYGVEQLAEICRKSRVLSYVSVYRPGLRKNTGGSGGDGRSLLSRAVSFKKHSSPKKSSDIPECHTNKFILENEVVMHQWIAAANANPSLESVLLFVKPPEGSGAWLNAFHNLEDALACNHILRTSRASALDMLESGHSLGGSAADVVLNRSVSVPNIRQSPVRRGGSAQAIQRSGGKRTGSSELLSRKNAQDSPERLRARPPADAAPSSFTSSPASSSTSSAASSTSSAASSASSFSGSPPHSAAPASSASSASEPHGSSATSDSAPPPHLQSDDAAATPAPPPPLASSSFASTHSISRESRAADSLDDFLASAGEVAEALRRPATVIGSTSHEGDPTLAEANQVSPVNFREMGIVQPTRERIVSGQTVLLSDKNVQKKIMGEKNVGGNHVLLSSKRSFLLVQYLCKRFPNVESLSIRNVHFQAATLPTFFNMLQELKELELTNCNLTHLTHLPAVRSLVVRRNARFRLDHMLGTGVFPQFSTGEEGGTITSEQALIEPGDLLRMTPTRRSLRDSLTDSLSSIRRSPSHAATPERYSDPEPHSGTHAQGEHSALSGVKAQDVERPSSFPREMMGEANAIEEALSHIQRLASTLRHLAFPSNQLSTFPLVLIEHFTALQTLDLSHNRLESIPDSISVMKHMRVLRLANNKIKALPLSLSLISESLKLIDISGNPIAHSDLRALSPTVSYQNTEHILALLSSLWKARCSVKQIKILVLGHGNVGKTACINALKGLERRRDAQPDVSALSTIAIEVDDANMQWIANDEIEFSVWDFAGQLEYMTTHQYFLSRRNAIYVVMVDLSEPIEVQEKQLTHWLSFLQSKLPHQRRGHAFTYNVMVVGSKKDNVIVPLGSSASVRNAAITTYARQIQLHLERQSYLPVIMSEPKVISVYDPRSLVDLREALRRQARILLSSESLAMVPRYFSDVRDRVKEWADAGAVPSYMAINQLESLLSENHIRCDEAAIQFLHDIGVVVYSNHTRCVCIRPKFLAKAMAVFVCPEEHLERMTRKPIQMHTARHAILSAESARDRIRLLLDPKVSRSSVFVAPEATNEDEVLDSVMKLLEEFDLCYRLTPREVRVYGEEGYLFPSLRPVGELFLLPPHLADPKRASGDGDALKGGESNGGANGTEARPLLICGQRAMDRELHGLPNELFFRYQVRLRPWHDHRYKLYCNGTIVLDEHGNQGLVVLHNSRINMIVRGYSPHLFLEQLVKELLLLEEESEGVQLRITWLCPYCTQVAGLYRSVNGCQQGHEALYRIPADFDGDLGDDVERDVDESGDAFDDHQNIDTTPPDDRELLPRLDRGVPIHPQLSARNVLWDPVLGDRFYEDQSNISLDGNAPRWLIRDNPDLKCTVLTSEESNGARRAEYRRVRDLFFKFLGKDREKDFELTKVVYLHNKKLESRFEAFYRQLVLESMLREDAGSAMFEEHPGDDEEKRKWRRWVLTHLHQYVERVSGNERINLVAAWHGTSEAACYGIASTGFRPVKYLSDEQVALLERNPASFFMTNPQEKDPGYFGRGIYFTQFPSYGDEYVEMCRRAIISKQLEEEKKSRGGGDGEVSGSEEREVESRLQQQLEEQDYPLLLSWVLLGKVWPVVNGPTDKNNFYGKPCKEGYNSHYTVVNKQKLPCNPEEEPYYDELVVFNPEQILPRYLIHYRRRKKVGAFDLMTSVDSVSSSGEPLSTSDSLSSISRPSQSLESRPSKHVFRNGSDSQAHLERGESRPPGGVGRPYRNSADTSAAAGSGDDTARGAFAPSAPEADDSDDEGERVLPKTLAKLGDSSVFSSAAAVALSAARPESRNDAIAAPEYDADRVFESISPVGPSPTTSQEAIGSGEQQSSVPFNVAVSYSKSTDDLGESPPSYKEAVSTDSVSRSPAHLTPDRVPVPTGGRGVSLPRPVTSRSPSPQEIRIVIWIDPHPSIQSYKPLIRQKNSTVTLMQMRSGEEAKVWMTARQEQLLEMSARNSFRVITNRMRQGDGGSMAGQRFCEWMRAENSPWKSIPVMMYCKEDRSVRHLSSLLGIIVTCEPEHAIRFCAMEDLPQRGAQTGSQKKDDCAVC